MKSLIQSALLLSLALGTAAFACQVPVFRYALERWPADNYEFVVLHDGPLDEKTSQAISQLKRSSRQLRGSSNHTVTMLRPSQIDDPQLAEAWSKRQSSGDAVLVSLFPRSSKDVPDRIIEIGPVTSDRLKTLTDSPIRKTISDRLVHGESAVRIFVPCGDESQDRPAMETLSRVLKQNEGSLELPEQEEIADEKELLEQIDLELRLDFSIVTLKRDDPKEKFLLQCLLASEPDLEELNQPMAFPVLGRGRVLYALVGKGISEFTITEASRFIIGPCSCQVKNQNPGFDLLMDRDWDQMIGNVKKLSEPLSETSDEPVLLQIPPGRKR